MDDSMFAPPGRPVRRPPGDKIIIVCCAFCARVRDSAGRWVRVPETIGKIFHGDPVALSHGYCPDCIARHFS